MPLTRQPALRPSARAVIAAALLLCAMSQPASAQVTTRIYASFGDLDGTPFSDLVGTLDTPGITFATDTGYDWHPFERGSFGAESTATLYVSAAGTYTFSLNSDDGSSLYIDGIRRIDNGGGHGPNTVTESFALTAGAHSLTVNFYEDFGGSSGVDLTLPAGTSFVSGVPEPEGYAMLLAGLGLVGFIGRRQKLRAGNA